MSVGADSSSSKSQGSSFSKSDPLNPKQVGKYWGKLNRLTAGNLDQFATQGTPTVGYDAPQEPAQFFGTDLRYQPVQQDMTYRPVSDQQIKSLGGFGESRMLEARQGRQQTLDEILANAGLTVAQSQRSKQLSDRDYQARADAIAAEREAAIAEAALTQAARDMAGRQSQGEFNAGQAQAEWLGRRAGGQQQQDLAAYLADLADRKYQAGMGNLESRRRDLLALAEIFFGGKGQSQISTDSNSTRQSSSGAKFGIGR